MPGRQLCFTDTASHAPSILVPPFHSGAHASTFSHTSSYHQWFGNYLLPGGRHFSVSLGGSLMPQGLVALEHEDAENAPCGS